MIETKREELKEMASRALDELAMALDDGHSESLQAYLTMLARFHRYSTGNVLLIAMQRPDATRVAGYRTWQKLGRQVCQGERAIRIMAPVLRRRKPEADEEDPEPERMLTFRPASVFDVSQTNGDPLPDVARAGGDPGRFLENLKALVRQRGIELTWTTAIGPAQGASEGGKIWVRPDLEPAEAFSTLVHELAHEMLHQGGSSTAADKRTRELEAEAVAFTVSDVCGLEAREASRDYIHLYDGDKKALLASLERIRTTAAEILGAVLPAETADESPAELQDASAGPVAA